METTTSKYASSTQIRRNSNALSTMPSAVSPYRLMMRSDSDPWLVPIRMALPRVLHLRTNGVNFTRMRDNSSS